jgi:hypothetical protein
MNLYLKLFLFTSTFFGIFMGICYSFLYGYSTGLFVGIFSGLLFGIYSSLFIRYKQHKTIKQLGLEISDETLDAHQTRELDLNVPYDNAYDFCLKFIQLMRKGRIKTEDRSKGIIVAKIGMKLKRNPCIILFKLQKTNNAITHIEVSSKPSIPIINISSIIVDGGTSLEYVTLILNFLNREEKRFLTAKKTVPRKTSRGTGVSHRRHGTGGGMSLGWR